MCICVYMNMCIHVYVCMGMHLCVCVCMCERMCVCVCNVTFMMLPRDVWALRISQLTEYNSSTYPLTFSREGGNPPFHTFGLAKGFQRRPKLLSNYLIMHPDVLWFCSWTKVKWEAEASPLLHSRIEQAPPIRGAHICVSIRLLMFIKPRGGAVLSVPISSNNVHSYCERLGLSLSHGQCTGSIMSLHPTCRVHRVHPVPVLGGPFTGWSNRVKHSERIKYLAVERLLGGRGEQEVRQWSLHPSSCSISSQWLKRTGSLGQDRSRRHPLGRGWREMFNKKLPYSVLEILTVLQDGTTGFGHELLI